ncbi:MAG: hypothetical protein WBV82_12625 [Myxococcaceae bacterium]
MAWTVRNENGALDFETFDELERAYRVGLVEPDDEVRDPNSHAWRRAGGHPRLVQARAAQHTATSPVPFGYILVAVLLTGVTLYVVVAGGWWLGLLLAMVVAAMLVGVTSRAFRLRRA